jgi:hypothetical protein
MESCLIGACLFDGCGDYEPVARRVSAFNLGSVRLFISFRFGGCDLSSALARRVKKLFCCINVDGFDGDAQRRVLLRPVELENFALAEYIQLESDPLSQLWEVV